MLRHMPHSLVCSKLSPAGKVLDILKMVKPLHDKAVFGKAHPDTYKLLLFQEVFQLLRVEVFSFIVVPETFAEENWVKYGTREVDKKIKNSCSEFCGEIYECFFGEYFGDILAEMLSQESAHEATGSVHLTICRKQISFQTLPVDFTGVSYVGFLTKTDSELTPRGLSINCFGLWQIDPGSMCAMCEYISCSKVMALRVRKWEQTLRFLRVEISLLLVLYRTAVF